MTKLKIGEVLLKQKLINVDQLEQALLLQKAKKKRLGKILKELGFVSDESIAVALSHQLGLPVVKIKKGDLGKELSAILSQGDAEKYMAIPVSIKGKQMTLAMSDPTDLGITDEIRFKTGYDIIPVIATEQDILSGIEKLYQVEERIYDLMKSFDYHEEAEFLKEQREENETNVQSIYTAGEAPPIIKLVTMLIVEAVKMRASDIHIEPGEENVGVRYRIDGDLRDIMKLPKRMQDSVVSRVKIICEMDITNRRLPQDGTTKLKLSDREIDLRISTLPSLYGETIVVRLLDKSKGLVTLADVGFPEKIQSQLIRILTQPQGFVLVTGPTGSGKSTTLYALIQQLKSVTANLITVEDPIEYRLAGITQVGVRESIGLTFASVLRSVLRQDPDIIMVGEIRDLETADIAMKASLTGHLVLSTLHTNDTVSSIARLIDIGIPPFLVGSALSCILAQRLVKKICVNCKVPDNSFESEEGFERLKAAYKGAGCDYCRDTGYFGQTGIYEFLPITPKIKRMIAKNSPEDEIWEEAKAIGVKTLFEDAVDKVAQGITTIEEVIVKIPNFR